MKGWLICEDRERSTGKREREDLMNVLMKNQILKGNPRDGDTSWKHRFVYVPQVSTSSLRFCTIIG